MDGALHSPREDSSRQPVSIVPLWALGREVIVTVTGEAASALPCA